MNVFVGCVGKGVTVGVRGIDGWDVVFVFSEFIVW